MRLCVVSLNPAIDAEWRVEDVQWEEKNVIRSQRRWPGGKGVNVARWLQFLGADAELLIPLGGAVGRELRAGLRAMELRTRVVPLRSETRVNVVITTARGRQMRFNPPGPVYHAPEWQAVLRTAEKVLRQGGVLILSGALPPGVAASAYAELIRLGHRHARPAFLDCDGEALVLGARARPFLVKPNRHELERWSGRKLPGLRTAARAAWELSGVTGGWVLLSLGARGAILVNQRESFARRADPPAGPVLNTVGAGDAMLAASAFASVRGVDPEGWLCQAVAAGTAATRVAAGKFPSRQVWREVLNRTAVRSLRL